MRAMLTSVVDSVASELRIATHVHEASSGTSALAMCSERRPVLLICEVLLEGVSGLALLRRVHSNAGRKPAVIFVTDLVREIDRYWGLRNGATAYLSKPCDETALRHRVLRVLKAPTPQSPRPL